MPDADPGPEGLSSCGKFAAVLESAALNEADPARIGVWRAACELANDGDRASTARTRQATQDAKTRIDMSTRAMRW